MDHLGLHSAVHIGESGGAPYAAACAALHSQRSQALLLLAGLAAVHGREHAGLRKSLSAMDRFSMNWAARLGGARLISHFVKLAADVSASGGVQVGVGLCGRRGMPVRHSLFDMAPSSCCCCNADMRLHTRPTHRPRFASPRLLPSTCRAWSSAAPATRWGPATPGTCRATRRPRTGWFAS